MDCSFGRPWRIGSPGQIGAVTTTLAVQVAGAAGRGEQVIGWFWIRCGWGWLGEGSRKMALTRFVPPQHARRLVKELGRVVRSWGRPVRPGVATDPVPCRPGPRRGTTR